MKHEDFIEIIEDLLWFKCKKYIYEPERFGGWDNVEILLLQMGEVLLHLSDRCVNPPDVAKEIHSSWVSNWLESCEPVGHVLRGGASEPGYNLAVSDSMIDLLKRFFSYGQKEERKA